MTRFASYDPSMGISPEQYSQKIKKINESFYGPDRNIYANENSGLNGLFPPRSDIQQFKDLQASKPTPPPRVGYDLKPEGASDQDWQGYLDAKASAQKQRDEGFLGRVILGGEGGYDRWKQYQGKQGYLEPLIDQDFTPRPSGGAQEYRPEMIRPAVIQPPSITMPTPQPPKTGGPFGGGGKGGNFLNRFERLLDGLEGLVGKLGADGSTPESPFSSGGGGLSDAIETPFTPTQDY